MSREVRSAVSGFGPDDLPTSITLPDFFRSQHNILYNHQIGYVKTHNYRDFEANRKHGIASGGILDASEAIRYLPLGLM